MSIHDVLSQPSPAIDVHDACAVAIGEFGLNLSPDGVTPLAGERDRNFHVRDRDGVEFVLKFSHPSEQVSVADFQVRALQHIEATVPSLPVQRVRPTRSGDRVHVHAPPGQPLRAVRVFSYLPGLPLPEAQPSAVQISALGTMLARLGLALRDFHPALGSGNEEKLPWDLQHAGDLRALTVHLPDATQRSLAEQQLRRFDEQTVPAMQAFRRQAIHNDLNIHNVLVAPDDHARISGILDFGDMVCAPLINDVAVAASYQLGSCFEGVSSSDAELSCGRDAGRVEESHPIAGDALWANVLVFVAAYHAVSPLKTEEIDVLFDLIVTRLVMVVTTGGWRAARHPENAAYILRNNAVSWRRLIACSGASRGEVTAALHAACA